MIPKFNKQTGRWGIWCPMYELWMCNLDTEQPLRFQSKQEAAARVRIIQTDSTKLGRG